MERWLPAPSPVSSPQSPAGLIAGPGTQAVVGLPLTLPCLFPRAHRRGCGHEHPPEDRQAGTPRWHPCVPGPDVPAWEHNPLLPPPRLPQSRHPAGGPGPGQDTTQTCRTAGRRKRARQGARPWPRKGSCLIFGIMAYSKSPLKHGTSCFSGWPALMDYCLLSPGNPCAPSHCASRTLRMHGNC